MISRVGCAFLRGTPLRCFAVRCTWKENRWTHVRWKEGNRNQQAYLVFLHEGSLFDLKQTSPNTVFVTQYGKFLALK